MQQKYDYVTKRLQLVKVVEMLEGCNVEMLLIISRCHKFTLVIKSNG